MTPVQFFGALKRSSWQDGERRLMAAVLQEGVETFQKYAFTTEPAERELFEEARSWVVARFDRSLFSFTTLCEMLGIDADYLRSGLLGWESRSVGRLATVASSNRTAPVRRVQKLKAGR